MIYEIIIILVLLTLAALLSPLIIRIDSARRDGKISGYFSIRWIIFNFNYLFTEKRSEIRILDRPLAGKAQKETAKINKTNKKTRSGKIPIRDSIDLIRPIFRLMRELIGCFRIKDVHIDARIGTNDPAHTGFLAGAFYSAAGCFKTDRIRLAFDFEKPCLEWDLIARGAIIPINVLIAFLRFFTDRHVLSAGFRTIRG